MTDHDPEALELRALQRQLDDAFETTRPRPDFGDELWLRVRSSRPAPRRLRDALAGLWQGVRELPAVPAAATALVLVVAIGTAIFVVGGFGHGGGGVATTNGSTAGGGQGFSGPMGGQDASNRFGRLPSPVFATPSKTSTPAQYTPAGSGTDYAGPVRYVWSGTFDLKITAAPVYRYREPSPADADAFATALGGVLQERPGGFLGAYKASDYTLKVRGTTSSPPSSPAYFIFSGLNMPAVEAAGGQDALADVFLAQHGLQPQWRYAIMVDSSGDPTRVVYQRQFEVPDYGPAYLVDYNANRYGLEVDLSANRPVVVSGMLPTGLDVARYPIANPASAIQSVVSSFAADPTGTPAPPAQLNHAELVYVLVPATDHGFYEPAYLFTGTVDVGGKTYTRRVLVPAVDPSQRTP